MHHLRSSTPQSPAGPVVRLGPGIRPLVGTLNCAPGKYYTQIRDQLFPTRATFPPPEFAHCAHNNVWWHTEEIFLSKNKIYQCINQELEGNRTKIRRLKLTNIKITQYNSHILDIKLTHI